MRGGLQGPVDNQTGYDSQDKVRHMKFHRGPNFTSAVHGVAEVVDVPDELASHFSY